MTDPIAPAPEPSPAELAVAADAHTLLRDALATSTTQLKMSTQELALYTAQRAAVLSTLVGQPGFDLAVVVERDNVALKAAIELGHQASGADQRAIGIIQSALLFGAKILVAAP